MPARSPKQAGCKKRLRRVSRPVPTMRHSSGVLSALRTQFLGAKSGDLHLSLEPEFDVHGWAAVIPVSSFDRWDELPTGTRR